MVIPVYLVSVEKEDSQVVLDYRDIRVILDNRD
jgi:hypothetical protein